MKTVSQPYYDAEYFAWQCPGGELSALMDRWKFEPFIREGDAVLDFGCGGGFLLGALQCGDRYGVEVNPAARAKAATLVNAYANLEDLPSVLFDVIISHHALEHVDDPLDVIQQLGSRLKAKGRLILVVPSEDWHKQKVYRPNDINQHLYTWTPLSLGNLVTRAGLRVEQVDLLCHSWVPMRQELYRLMPLSISHLICRAWGIVTRTRQVRIIASRLVTD